MFVPMHRGSPRDKAVSSAIAATLFIAKGLLTLEVTGKPHLAWRTPSSWGDVAIGLALLVASAFFFLQWQESKPWDVDDSGTSATAIAADKVTPRQTVMTILFWVLVVSIVGRLFFYWFF